MSELTAEDIAAMRADGSFAEFLKHLGTGGNTAPKVTAGEQPAAEVRELNRRPGAWPTGTRPPGPVEPQDPAAWQRAVDEYRAYLAGAGEPEGPANCQCSGCLAIAATTRRVS